VASAATPDKLEQARNAARAQIAFYGSTPAYRGVLEIEGYSDLHPKLNRLSKRGKWLEMAGHIDDDLLDRIATTGRPDEIALKLRERYAGWVDRVSLVVPFAPDPDEWAHIVRELRAS
jgi:alkanesulfonate monooxygenase SsuD/methylene tetrahydromethanopterin reductase-like flavin-dependent oxidoreductase (luciferase family)